MSREAHLGKRAQWLDRLRRFNRSKFTAAEFCRREGVSQASFYQWRRRLATASAEAPDEDPLTRASFIPVQLTSAAQLQVVFPNGVRLTLPAHDDELIMRAIAAIAQAPTTSGDL